MDKCTKFKVFNILLLFCATNFFLYRYFSQPDPPMVVAPVDTKSNSVAPRPDSSNSGGAINNGTRSILSVTNSKNNISAWLEASNKPVATSGEKLSRDTGGSGQQDVAQTDKSKPISTDKAEPSNPVTSDSAQSSNTAEGKKPTEENKPPTTAQSQAADVSQPQLPAAVKNSSALATAAVMGPLPQCPLVPPRLNGALATYSEGSSFEEIAKENQGLMPGGRYKPPDCIARHRVAIVIPYRNRDEHLKILLKNLHPMLMRQQLDYGIYIIDQALPGKFNRAMLMNIGYVEAMKRYDYQCAIFHDVDLIPENDKNIYSCPEQPRHLSAAIDKFKYRLPYANIYGGVSAVSKEQFEKINGFSNMFFGWGGEDDDMAARIHKAGFKITRYPMEIARYKMIKHTKDSGNESNPQRFGLLKTTAARMATDGLNSLVYTVQQVEELPSHTRIQVLINESDIVKKA